MKVEEYLAKYYKDNNSFSDCINLRKRLFCKSLIFVITSIIYYLLITFSKFKKFSGDISLVNTIKPLKIIMIVCTIIGGISLILYLFRIFFNKKFTKVYNSVKFSLKKGIYNFLDWTSILPICIVVVIFIFSYLFIITPVEGSSMMNTIKEKDQVLVLYNQKIERGKIVIIEVNNEDYYMYDEKSSSVLSDLRNEITGEYESKHWIKRVIGLPGDKIRYISGNLYITKNNEEEQLVNENYDAINGISIYSNFNGIFRYRKDGKDYETDVIPDGYVFVMGDNRPVSMDSRYIGLVPIENVVGVATRKMKYFIPGEKLI